MNLPDSGSTNKTASRPLRVRGWKRFGLLVAFPVVGFVVMLVATQRSLIYQPFKTGKLPARQAGHSPGQAHDVATITEDQVELNGWLVLSRGRSAKTDDELNRELAKGRPVVLYFGGNAANRSHRGAEVNILVQANADVLIFDYRGYGENSGDPSEEGLARDARAVWKFATESKKIDPRRIVLFGESLGGGVAIRLAEELCQAKTPPAGIILRSTFSSLPDAAAIHFPWLPVRWLLFDRFPSEQRIRNVICPILQFHGRRDTIVPFSLGQRLFSAAPEKSSSGIAKRFVELPAADHNDVMETSSREVAAAISAFLKELAITDQNE